MRQTCEHVKTSNNPPCFAVRPGEAADGPIDSDLVWARLLSSNDAGQVNSSQFFVFFTLYLRHRCTNLQIFQISSLYKRTA